MLIGIDGNEANIEERVGVNVWAIEMLKHLKGIRDKGQGIREDTKFTIYLSLPPLADLPPETENWRYWVIGPGKFWTRWRLPLDLYFHFPRPDVFLSLSHYAPKWAPIPRVICIMDLSFLKYPEAFQPLVLWQLKHWTEESVRNAAHVITISEFNKKEIIREYKYPGEKITVIYPGISEIFKGPTLSVQSRTLRILSEKYGIGGRYLLFVGTRQPKKNLDRLIQAFELIHKDYPDVSLVIVGKIWGQFSDKREEGRGKREERIRYLGYVPNEDLPALYAGAEALVLPSLYEGFGIPVTEAMRSGILVAAGNTTSLPEVVGDAGILFNPWDVKDMADKIGLALSMGESQKRKLIEKGIIRAEGFDWDKAADKIMKVLYAR